MLRALAPLLAALTLAACGTSPTPTREKVEETVETLLATCSNGDGTAAIDILSPPVRKQFLDAPSTLEGCRRALGFELEPLQRVLAAQVFEESRVAEVTLRGGFATVAIEQPKGERSEVELESTGDLWLLANPRRPPFAP